MSAVAVFAVRARRVARGLWRRPRVDMPLMTALVLLMLTGLATLYSAGDENGSLVMRQGAKFLLGVVLMLAVSHIRPTTLRAWTPWLYVFSMLMLVAVAILGEAGHGATRWLDLGIVRFEPSELLKLAVPMAVAWYLHPRELPPSWRSILTAGVLLGIPTLLIARQPDLGTALLVATAGGFCLFLAGMRWWRIGLLGALAAGVAPVAWHFLHGYQRQRVLTFLNPQSDPLGAGWHIIQSKIAVGSGGLLGEGFHQGTQSRLQFLPEHTTDFVFAVFGEEFGLVGAILLLALYAFIVGRCLWIAMQARDTYSRLLSGAIGMSFFVYVMVNGGMITGLLPVVGVPLPLISYGGTSAVTLLVGFGVVMSIRSHPKLWT